MATGSRSIGLTACGLNFPYDDRPRNGLRKLADHGRGTALMFARTETDTMHRYVWERATGLLFLRGRLFFHHADGTRAKHNGGAPSVLCAYGQDDLDRLAASDLDGKIVPLRFARFIAVAGLEGDCSWADAMREFLKGSHGPVSVSDAYRLFRPASESRAQSELAREGTAEIAASAEIELSATLTLRQLRENEMPCIQYRRLQFQRRTGLALIDRANDIIATYRSQGYTLTLRQLYYQFVSRDLIPNTERSYKNLGSAISDGRDAGLIDWEAIEDRGRGVKAWLIDEDEKSVLDMIEYRFAMDFWQRQNCYVEVWVEKDALSSVIERACRKRSVPYMACKGYLSASEAWRAGQRFEDAADMGAERLVMIHLGDHDPSGIDMTRDNADRLQLYSRGADIEVRRIALNMDQVRRYNPPENPAKVTDTRAADYIRKLRAALMGA
jgi:hypothetical protein